MAQIVRFFTVGIFTIFVGYGVFGPFSLLSELLSCLIDSGNKNSACFLSDVGLQLIWSTSSPQGGHYCSDAGNAASESIVISCDFEPLDVATMEKDFREDSLTMRGLLNWQNPHKRNITIEIKKFSPFLPSAGKRVGCIWFILEPVVFDEIDISMRLREDEPPQNTAASVLYRILSMFHKNVFLQTRFTPRGTIAILRAQNSDFVDIVFRCHCEFQLNNPPLLPFWFTPAQFQGQLIIAKNASKIKKFSMVVPTDRKLNVDMEWFNKIHEDMEVDIGFIPQMSLHTADIKDDHIAWNEEISIEEAHKIIGQKMFPFKEVLYKPIVEALEELNGQHKPLHCIVLWGALDDQSC